MSSRFQFRVAVALCWECAMIIPSAGPLQTVVVPDGASMEERVRLAASVRPHPRQIAYQDLEYIAFIHFGPNTFSGVEWGSGKEQADIFQPDDLDCDQWVRVMKEAGMKLALITVKHHDGFCLWQTRYNDKFSMRATSWRDGKGDVLRELTDACRKHGLKVGVYLSPADLYQIESPDGLYGNGSKYTTRTIPEPVPGARPFASDKRFEFEVDDYNAYMLNQLYECLTEYGPIHEVWFDGAHPKRKGNQTYTYSQWYELIHALHPDAVIAIKGPDVRWIGNEAGGTRDAEWNVISMREHPDEFQWPDMTGRDLGSRATFAKARAFHWWPAEQNTSIRHGWFWRDDTRQHVKSADHIFELYEKGVGGNATFLLNIPPNREGKFSQRDVDVLLEVGRRIRSTYGVNLLADAEGPKALLDEDAATFWEAPDMPAAVEFKLPEARRVNRFAIQEAQASHGQVVEGAALDVWVDGTWKEVATEPVVGHKRIFRFNTVVADQFRVRLTAARATPALRAASAHYFAAPPSPVSIARAAAGKVTLSAKDADEIRFTLNGAEPTADSPLYGGPFDIPNGGLLQARSFSGGAAGEVASMRMGIAKTGWTAVANSEHDANHAGSKAIDGDPNTFWHTSWGKDQTNHPHNLVIDLGQSKNIGGFGYLTRQDRKDAGAVDNWIFEVSASVSGDDWREVKRGKFGNLLNDPTLREVFFDATDARRVRFTSLSCVNNKPWGGAAEIEIFPASTGDRQP